MYRYAIQGKGGIYDFSRHALSRRDVAPFWPTATFG
jgi:hypothetical protein